MPEKKPYSDRRWRVPMKGRVVGHREIPKEEQIENRKIIAEILLRNGQIKSIDELPPIDDD